MSHPSDKEAVDIPKALERSEVPHYFRQFQSTSVLKMLAHTGKGPLYQLIGRRAWYETADIVNWLNSRKRQGPPRAMGDEKTATSAAPATDSKLMHKRRGRPTKAAQRRLAELLRSS